MGNVAGARFIGLPGNPVAAFITVVQVARPLMAALSGAELPMQHPGFLVQAAFKYRNKAGRREYVRLRLAPGPDSVLRVHKHGVEGAGTLTPLTKTSGLAELTDQLTAIAPGDPVGYLPCESLP